MSGGNTNTPRICMSAMLEIGIFGEPSTMFRARAPKLWWLCPLDVYVRGRIKSAYSCPTLGAYVAQPPCAIHLTTYWLPR